MGLAEQFEQELRTNYMELVGLKFSSPIFERMLGEHGGVETAKRLVKSSDEQSGFRRIVQLGRPELTLEAVMLQPKYASLFTRTELEWAKGRLALARLGSER